MKEKLLSLIDDFMQLFKGYREEGEERNKEDDPDNVFAFIIILLLMAGGVYFKIYA